MGIQKLTCELPSPTAHAVSRRDGGGPSTAWFRFSPNSEIKPRITRITRITTGRAIRLEAVTKLRRGGKVCGGEWWFYPRPSASSAVKQFRFRISGSFALAPADEIEGGKTNHGRTQMNTDQTEENMLRLGERPEAMKTLCHPCLSVSIRGSTAGLSRIHAVGGAPPSRRLTAWEVHAGNFNFIFCFTIQ